MVNMTKCRRVYTLVHAAKGSQIPPLATQQAASVASSSSAQRGPILAVFSTNPFYDVLQEIMTETGFWTS